MGSALVFQHQQLALNGSNRRLGHIAETLRGLAERSQSVAVAIHRLFAGVRYDGIQQRPDILHIDQRETVLISNTERDIEDAFLHVVQIEHP